ncbi:uncharacterized protein LOC135171755 [Diachasmimorpha longicaudata]|uniref:uncharacterized protein LOC135171755 n=1 Tax=Diachasmimorpha longicaudata TaxID=58733 RepID=UPI0030B8C1E5
MTALMTKTNRGREKYIHNAHMFTFDKMSANGERKFWRCEFKNDCKARIHTSAATNEVVKEINEHTHGNDIAFVQATKVKEAMKRRAADTPETPAQIINNSLTGCPSSVKAKLPKKDSLRKIIERVRNKVNAVPPAPANLEELIIPDNYKNYVITDGDEIKFLLADSGNSADRILIFGREDNQNWSQYMKTVFMDGTFKQSPPLFSQVYVILAARGRFVFPVLYALLPDKRESTYDHLFHMIKELWPQFNPNNISIDYELAAHNSIGQKFSEANIFGCLFHLTKNVKLKLGEEGLIKHYNNEPEFAVWARMIPALAFIPMSHIETAIETLYDILPDALHPVLQYFEDTYMGPMRRNKRGRARFPPSTWSVHERTLANQDRTNNFAEAAHRRLQRELDVSHPSLWKFIDGLRTVQSSLDAYYEGTSIIVLYWNIYED